MTTDTFRAAVQTALAKRGVTDIAFTPLDADNEQVSFWQNGIRAHFTLRPVDYVSGVQFLEPAIMSAADGAFAIAQHNASLAKAAAQAKADEDKALAAKKARQAMEAKR